MFPKAKKTPKNPLTDLLANKDIPVEGKIKEIFGNPEYVNILPNSLRSEIEPLLDFIIFNIEQLIDYVLKDPKESKDFKLEKGTYAMISRNIALSLSTPSNKLRGRLSTKITELQGKLDTTDDEAKKEKMTKGYNNADIFQKRMIDFVGSEDANENTSNHWGKIMSSFATSQKYMFFKDEIDDILPKMIINSEFPGYRELIQALASQGTTSVPSDKIFRHISEGIADNMREYRIYSRILEDKEGETLNLLYYRTFYLLKIINQCYGESIDLNLGTWEDKYVIVKNLLEATFTETEKKLVLDAGVNALCIILDIINKSYDEEDHTGYKCKCDGAKNSEPTFDEMESENIGLKPPYSRMIRKLVRAKGKSFYTQQGLYNDTITPEMTSKDLEKYDLVIRTFPIFWEAGIDQLSPLLFHGCNDKGEFPKDSKDTITPSKVAKTITDKVCKWISIVNAKDTDLFSSTIKVDTKIQDIQKKQANKKLIKFIEGNNIVENLMKYFPRNLLKEGRLPFLNPFIIILAELLSVGYIKPKIEYNGSIGESVTTYNITSLGNSDVNEYPQSMENDEFTRFIFEQVIPVSTELLKFDI